MKSKTKKTKKPKRNMRNITINLPDLYDERILRLQKMGISPSRSEFVRNAIRVFLKQEIKNLKLLKFDKLKKREIINKGEEL